MLGESLRTCKHRHTRTHTDTDTHTRTHTHNTHTHMHTHRHKHTHVHINPLFLLVNTHTQTHTRPEHKHTHTHTHTHTHACTHMHACTQTRTCIHINPLFLFVGSDEVLQGTVSGVGGRYAHLPFVFLLFVHGHCWRGVVCVWCRLTIGPLFHSEIYAKNFLNLFLVQYIYLNTTTTAHNVLIWIGLQQVFYVIVWNTIISTIRTIIITLCWNTLEQSYGIYKAS